MENFVSFVKKHSEWCTVLGLGILFYFIFFHNIGTYALMDTDETRYVAMSRDMFHTKDYLTLYLNGEYFFEKPPLYFWMECLSFGLFGKVNEFAARFPVALCGTLCSFMTYFVGKRIVSRGFGIISALILATCLEFVMLSKFAILDIVVSVCISFSVYTGIMTFFCKEKNKKYFWWMFYFFSGLAVMAKGIPGFVIPFGSMFFLSVINGKFKEIFKPIYIIPGILVFLLVTLPWHLIMFKIHNPLFFDEYIIKHHLHRFVNSQDLGRKEPWFFFILVFLWGFIPWIFSMLSVGISKLKSLNLNILKKFSFNSLDTEQKFLFMNSVVFIFTMLFFSSSSTKLVTYILPIYIPSAFIAGYIWKNYILKSDFEKPINISVYIWGGICILASIVAIFTEYYLPQGLNEIISSIKWFVILLLFLFGSISIIGVILRKKILVFSLNVLLILMLSAFGTGEIFNIDYKFGQDDLMQFAEYAKENNKELMTFGMSRKYSLLYYANKNILYERDDNYELLEEKLHSPEYVVIFRNKDIDKILENLNNKNIKTLQKGVKYSLVTAK